MSSSHPIVLVAMLLMVVPSSAVAHELPISKAKLVTSREVKVLEGALQNRYDGSSVTSSITGCSRKSAHTVDCRYKIVVDLFPETPEQSPGDLFICKGFDRVRYTSAKRKTTRVSSPAPVCK